MPSDAAVISHTHDIFADKNGLVPARYSHALAGIWKYVIGEVVEARLVLYVFGGYLASV